MTILGQALIKQITRADDRPNDADHAYASEAGHCARQIGYRLRDTPRTEPLTLTSQLSFFVGNSLHAQVQAAFKALYQDFQDEVSWKLDAVAGRADGIYTAPGGARVVCEIKSMHPMTFKYVSAPKEEHLLQGGLSAVALGAEYVHIVYLNKSAASGDKCLDDWLVPVQTSLREAIAEEQARLHLIVERAKGGSLPARVFEGGLITDPAKTKWPCQYCPWRARCMEDGA